MEQCTGSLYVFLAAPYTQWMDARTGMLDAGRRAYLIELHDALLDDGMAVFSAHRNEGWGSSWLPPEICTPADHLAVRRADVVCAVLGTPPSPGVLVELGWASALGKPLVVLAEGDPPQLVLGLHQITDVTLIRPERSWSPSHLAHVVASVRLAAETAPAAALSEVPGYPLTTLPFGYHLASA